MPRIRKRALMKTFNHVLANPERHHQQTWAKVDPRELDKATRLTKRRNEYELEPGGFIDLNISCGTTGCLAGWACALEGDKMYIPGAVFANSFPYNHMTEDEQLTISNVVTPEGEITELSERAIKHLGLPSDDGELTADKLFAPDNTLGYLRQAILQILNGNIYLHDEYRWYSPSKHDLPADILKPIRYSAKTKEYV